MYLSHFQSDKQKIELLKLPKFGLTLFLDGACQFSELNEKRYHETLSVIPMLFGEFENILICGGGVVDFGGSQFKPKANKGWWTVDGATFRGKFKSLRNRFRIGKVNSNWSMDQEGSAHRSNMK